MANARNPSQLRRPKGSRSLQTMPRAVVSMSFESNITESIAAFEQDIREHVVRSAAYAGAKVLYDAMRRIVPVYKGTLYGSIYHWFDKKHSTAARKIYLIGPNKREAPHWYNVEYGHWLYNRQSPTGQWLRSKSNKNARIPNPPAMFKAVHDLPGARDVPQWVPAQPYVRTTWVYHSETAMRAARARAKERIRDILRNRGAAKVGEEM